MSVIDNDPVEIAPRSLGRDDFKRLRYLVLDALDSDHSRRAYDKALADFMAWHEAQGRPGLIKATVQAYKAKLQADGLAASTINQRLAAVRALAREAADNGLLPDALAAGIAAIGGVKAAGVRTGNWLTLEQAQALLRAPDISTRKGLRDRAVLAVLLGGGLRRSELAALEFGHLASRDGRWVIVDLVGKGNRVRSVPIPDWTKVAIDAWAQAGRLGRTGRVFRAVNKADRVTGSSLSAQAIHGIVKEASLLAGVRATAHDLRRTYSKLARAGGSPLEQIQLSLGHASIQTTERYLGARQDLTDAPGDRLGLQL